MKRKEIWKNIRGYTGLYQVSNKGRVKSLKRTIITKFNGRTHTTPEKILKLLISKTERYYRVGIIKNHKYIKYSVARLVGKAFVKGYKPKLTINHKDCNKLNNNDWNLEWTTIKENANHAFQNGLFDKTLFKSENNIMSKMVLNLESGIYHDSLKEAYNTYSFDISYNGLYAMLKGYYNNKTSLIFV